MIAVAFGVAIALVVLWNMRGARRHNEGDHDAWMSDGSRGGGDD